MVDKYGVGDDPYCYPNTDVLINKFSIEDAAILEAAEAELSAIRLSQFHDNHQALNFTYFCALHFHLFQDLYDWAGEIRSVDISKGDTRFCNIARIDQEGENCFRFLEKHNYLRGTEIGLFVKRISHFFCEMNVVHPFREGNGRTLRLFCEILAKRAGYILSWEHVSQSTWLTANIDGYYGDMNALEQIFTQATHVIE